jgi:hypothetical protein
MSDNLAERNLNIQLMATFATVRHNALRSLIPPRARRCRDGSRWRGVFHSHDALWSGVGSTPLMGQFA